MSSSLFVFFSDKVIKRYQILSVLVAGMSADIETGIDCGQKCHRHRLGQIGRRRQIARWVLAVSGLQKKMLSTLPIWNRSVPDTGWSLERRVPDISFSLGETNRAMTNLTETPRKTTLVVFENAQCNDWLSSLRMRLLDNHLCAGIERGGKDACQVILVRAHFEIGRYSSAIRVLSLSQCARRYLHLHMLRDTALLLMRSEKTI